MGEIRLKEINSGDLVEITFDEGKKVTYFAFVLESNFMPPSITLRALSKEWTPTTPHVKILKNATNKTTNPNT